MLIKKVLNIIWLLTATLVATTPVHSQPDNGLGQVIQIRTNLRSFVGKPTWLLIIRDVDHNQVIPYLYDIERGDNFWIAITYSRNYLITVSELTFNPYGRKINNFCELESMGAIQRGSSFQVHITGKLSPNPDTFNCNVLKYADANFNINTPE